MFNLFLQLFLIAQNIFQPTPFLTITSAHPAQQLLLLCRISSIFYALNPS